ncbi:DNA polymerase III subunit beta family protein [Actinoallomurus soli]|uniref:DNA polymerase III subunit beta family protein n=1 Tax=Actinoallomurus soli TaxID=2952535 RepID=UPI0020931245|nr:MerR family transcriptional regulator [Actinoallomurus soli]MCO5970142.1 MerR family transcriptional regulator [Actinoallomurus soli]
MNDAEALVSIGTFARRVGLTPSALRFYDDCGVLRPARVDAATGYRYYAPDQEPRAVLVRRLRETGLPLVDASVVLDGDREEARAVLTAHARRTRDTAAAAQAAIDGLLRDLSGAGNAAMARVGGAELAGAVRQVAPSAARGAVREEFPVLGCVLVELTGQEVRLVATDRYRLAVRALRPSAVTGGAHGLLADAGTMKEIASWAMRLPEVAIEVDGRGARVHGDGEERPLPAVDGTFPDYRIVLDDLPAARHRLIVDRDALRTALADHDDGPVLLRTDERDRLVLGRAAAEVPSICTGPPLRIAFDPGVLLPAVEASVGPDVLLEISSTLRPVVVRSADQGSFTTLVMPVLQEEER